MKIIEQTSTEHALNDFCNDSTHFSTNGHEQIVYFQDHATGLQAIVGIHDTTLGPALGGLRFLEYKDEQAALKDVLRLSRGMTYKAAIAGLDVGGGKAVLMKKKGVTLTEALLRTYGTCVERLGGHYITAPDVNTTSEHMVHIVKSTRHVVSLPSALGGSGDPSKHTAYGVYIAMKAAAKKVFGTDALHNKKIGVQGTGKVGYFLIQLLCQEQATVYATDICPERLQTIANLCAVKVVAPENFHQLPLDIYAPCALGAMLNAETIPQLNCPIVVGAANNQLEQQERDGMLLLQKGIVYVPDFLANAGGLVNAAAELDKETYNNQLVKDRIEQLYTVCSRVLHKAEEERRPTQDVAQEMAVERIQSIKKTLAWSLKRT